MNNELVLPPPAHNSTALGRPGAAALFLPAAPALHHRPFSVRLPPGGSNALCGETRVTVGAFGMEGWRVIRSGNNDSVKSAAILGCLLALAVGVRPDPWAAMPGAAAAGVSRSVAGCVRA